MNLIATIGTVAIFAAAPASIGLIGDATFSADVPVRIPSRATLLDSDGNPTDGPSARIGRRGDDHGGNRPRGRRTEPGDATAVTVLAAAGRRPVTTTAAAAPRPVTTTVARGLA